MQKNNCSNTKIVLKDFSSIEKIVLPYSCASIKEIVDFCVKLYVKSNKIIRTVAGYNVVIRGYNIIKIRYLSYDCRGKVIVKKLISPFFITIPISTCFNIINVKADISYCDLDNCENTVLFYNIISICLSMSFTPAESTINCLNSCDDLKFKNDNYPPTTNTGDFNCKNDYYSFEEDNYLMNNDFGESYERTE